MIIGKGVDRWLRGSLLGLVLCGTGQALQARADHEATIEGETRLGVWLADWLNRLRTEASARPGESAEPYLPGLVWMVPEEVADQGRMKTRLLDSIDYREHSPGVAEADAAALRRFVARLPVTGRVVLDRFDPRWLEANPKQDPVLRKGQRVRLPARPVSVTVVWGNGRQCTVQHDASAFALEYARRCDTDAEPQQVWIVQPDGVVQHRQVAAWNQEAQDPPAPGAWIVVDDDRTPWDSAVLGQLARLMATQGPAPTAAAASVLPAPRGENRGALGHLAANRPRDLTLTASDWGVTGLLQTPTARMPPAGSAAMVLSQVEPYTHLNVNLQPLDWLEASFRYTDVSNRLYGPVIAGNQSYKDKSIDFKLRLSQEMRYLPELAVGVRDVGGTGLFAGEYLVASKRTGSFDWSLGLGWGYLGARGDLDNPLSIFGSGMDTRPVNVVGSGGTFNVDSLFRGPAALFGGVQYQSPWDDLVFKLEYDGNDYQHEPQGNNQRQCYPVNLGMVYRYSPNIDLSLAWERGDRLGLGLSFHGRLDKLFVPKLNDPIQVPVSPIYPTVAPDWAEVARLLEAQTGWRVLEMRQAGSELLVRFDAVEGTYLDAHMDRIAAVLHRDAPGQVLVFRVQSQGYGLRINEYLIDRQTWVEAQTRFVPVSRREPAFFERPQQTGFLYPVESLLAEKPQERLNGKLGLSYMQSLGGPDGFVLYQVAASGTANWRLRPDTWLIGNARARLLDNYDNFKYTAPSKLPRVRTHLREFLTTSELTLPLLQLTHVGRLGQDQFYSLYGGMLETMYGGVGGEWLYRPWGGRMALGADVNWVRQRGFEQDFSFRNYSTATGHVTLYWDTGVQDVLASVSIGKYLAGDVGLTLDLSRQFENGVRIGAYATKTDVSAEVFGEGSFDKGIYFDIPFDAFLTRSSGSIAHVLWQPLTRDGGAKLARAFPLINLTRGQAANTLKLGPPKAKLRNQFGDVPDGAPVEQRSSSVFKSFGEDLDSLGYNLTSRNVLSSLLYVGGITAVGALLDDPVDELARDYGDRRPMRALEDAGNALPFLAMGFSGLAVLGDWDARLTKPAFAALEAGAVSVVSSLGLKYAFGRARPESGQSSTTFDPLSKSNSNSSFPSMHSTLAWATLTPYAKAYDAPWLYGLAMTTNLARIGERKHWFSDTLAGALLGYGLGSFFWDAQRGKEEAPKLMVGPGEVSLEWRID